ncbi:MAG: molybdopterin-dependent oxidoreductase [Chloroflexota bacterium]|nr:molybdopterin-dependent oxidoreductase [Chloroflexota bacterium]
MDDLTPRAPIAPRPPGRSPVAPRSRIGRGPGTPGTTIATGAGAVGARRNPALAGMGAALVMLAAQLAWRLAGDGDGTVPSFPEIIVAAISRLTPLDVFGTVTETYGSLAKQTLFVTVLLGIIAFGATAGDWADRLARSSGGGFRRRIGAGIAVATGLLLFTGLVILPVAHLGIFAAASGARDTVRVQLLLTFALFGIAWGWLSAPAKVAPARAEDPDAFGRRQMLGRGSRALLAVFGLAVVGDSARRLLGSGPERDAGQSRSDAQAIANAARQPAPPPASPVATPGAGLPADPAAAFAALDVAGDLTPVITSTADFYHVSKNISDPTPSADGWELTIAGLVDREVRFSLDDLTARATTRKITTLCCISNELNGDLIGTAEWQGVPLRDLLTEAGVRPEALDVVARAADDYADSFPVTKALDPDTLLVVGMNGETLQTDHGFPARLIVPGIYGMKNVKWLERIELVAEDFEGYWQTRGWSDTAVPQIWGRIDTPAPGDSLAAGPVTLAGVAAAGDRGIYRVEVSLDDGETWAIATLEEPINAPLTWVRWLLPLQAEAGAEYKLRLRITDGDGVTAPRDRQPPLPDGATGWPGRTVEVDG